MACRAARVKPRDGGYVQRVRRTLLDAIDLLSSPARHERAAAGDGHRPWPAPPRSWVMAQTWVDLLFAHWRVPAERLERTLPAPLALDTHEGEAWLGITPFAVRNLRLRPTLPVPSLSAFPEVNVRTYVVYDGKPGIFFFSLDAASRLAVAAARRLYRLPYFRASMSIERHAGQVSFDSRRIESRRSAPAADLRATYYPTAPARQAVAGSLEHWLTERYCLYTLDDRGRVLRGEIHHPPWPLQPATAEIALNTMAGELGLELGRRPQLAHYAARQDVVFWSLEPA